VAQNFANLLQGATGNDPPAASTHAASGSGDAAAVSNAAARIATLMPQFLSALPAAAGSAAIARTIAVPMSDPGWPQALAAQVHWMAGGQVQSATLRLSPEHLGPIQVRIDLQQSQINVSFSAAHAETRAALADAVPRLRELLASGGLSLGQASVQQENTGSGSGPTPITPLSRAGAETVEPVAISVARALGLVDEYV
jgi:flagellar hook-length control protein FliK